MAQGLNAKGETPTAIVMWIGSIMAVLIMVLWIGRNTYPSHQEIMMINQDLEDLQYHMSDACSSYTIDLAFNPRTEQGYLILNGSVACMNTSHFHRCKSLICSGGYQAFDLGNMTELRITRPPNGTVSFRAIP